MSKKKIIKIIFIAVSCIALFLVFMFRVTIHNKISEIRVNSATKESNHNPDYFIYFNENVEKLKYGGTISKGEGILVFKKDNKIIYTDQRNQEDVPFIFGSETHYEKIKIFDLQDTTLQKIERFEKTKINNNTDSSAEEGDITFLKQVYSGTELLSAETHTIKKANATELYEILEQMR